MTSSSRASTNFYSLVKRFLVSMALAGTVAAAHGAEPGLRAGAAVSNITPKMGVPLDGTISQVGPAKHVHDELWVRCLVLDDGTAQLAFAEVDNTIVSREIHDAAKSMIEKRIGIPAGHICIAATHTHSTPRAVIGLKDDDLHREYLDDLPARIADGVVRAFNQVAPAEIAWGSFREPRYVHNRRWRLKEPVKNPFGDRDELVRMNPGRTDPNLDKPAGPVDDEVFVVALRHLDSKQPLALMANYGLHYVGGIPRGHVSADYFGVFADRIQQRWNADRLTPPFVGIMTNGTSGDVNAIDFSKPRLAFAPFDRMTQIADELSSGTMRLLPELQFRSSVKLRAAGAELTLRVRKPDAGRLAWAEQNRVPKEVPVRLTRPQIYAREALELSRFPETVSVRLQAFRIGDLAITQSPCETFAETGLHIKRESPFAGSTFTIELANGYSGYLPSAEQFELGGYETWPARSSFLEISAEARIRDGLISLLHQLDSN